MVSIYEVSPYNTASQDKLVFFMKLRIVLLSIFCLLLAACGKSHVDPYKGFRHLSEKQVYNQGIKHLVKGRYDLAQNDFAALIGLYPFSRYAEPSQLDLIYSYYKTSETEDAITAADRYIRLYPQNPHIAYAYYMRGLLQFTEGLTWMQRTWGTDPAARNLSNKQLSFLAFSQLVRFYPHSHYVGNALVHMQYIRNTFARHQLLIAQYYWDRGAYIAAANRAAAVVQHYDGTPSVEPALALMVRSYRKLGQTRMANNTLLILQHNFPASRVTKRLS